MHFSRVATRNHSKGDEVVIMINIYMYILCIKRIERRHYSIYMTMGNIINQGSTCTYRINTNKASDFTRKSSEVQFGWLENFLQKRFEYIKNQISRHNKRCIRGENKRVRASQTKENIVYYRYMYMHMYMYKTRL